MGIFQLFTALHRENGSSCDEWELPPELPSKGMRGVYGEHIGSYRETEEGTSQSTNSTTWEERNPSQTVRLKKKWQ